MAKNKRKIRESKTRKNEMRKKEVGANPLKRNNRGCHKWVHT